MNQKKAQVTLFVIIGLVLLLVVALFFTIRETGVEDVSTDTETVHDFSAAVATYEAAAAQCMASEGERLIKRIMANGGYLDPAAEGLVAVEAFPTRGSALSLGGDLIVPYWVEHRGSLTCRQDCTFFIRVPPLTSHEDEPGMSVEERLGSVLPDEIKACLDSIEVDPDYDLVRAGEYDVSVAIGEERVTYDLQEPVTFTYKPTGATMTLHSVQGESDVELRKLYDTATSLVEHMEFDNATSSFGDAVTHIIQAYSMTNDAELPPMSGGADFGTDAPRTWLLPDVKEALQLRLADNLPLIQVRGSATQFLFLDPNQFSQVMYNSGPFSPDIYFQYPEYVPQVSFGFFYDPAWDIELQVSPSNGYLISPEGGSFNLIPGLGFGMHDYSFVYDVRLPLLIVLTDVAAFDGDGLSLIFAIETGLAGNEPILYTQAPELTVNDTYDYFSDEDYFLDSVAFITAQDAFTGTPLENVSVTYMCGEDAVHVGTTDEQGMVVDFMPFCIGGLLTGSREGYYAGSVPVSVVDDEDVAVTLNFTPLQTFDLQVRSLLLSRYDAESGLWNVSSDERFIAVDDRLMLTLSRKVLPGENEHVEVKVINYSNEAEQTVMLAAGTYDVEAYLFTDVSQDPFIIPEDEVCAGGIFNRECHTLEPIVFNDTLFRGGYHSLVDEGGGFEVTADDYQNDTLIVKYLEIDPSDVRKHEDLEIL
ncbi:hypothetical protein GF367_00770, partial [Candidatus Woesearchaeota archaeon]|nr:hypothetical protein [Candidatus Woesearchaeota archaeon]